MYVISTSSAPPVAEGFGRGIPAGLFCTRRQDKVCQEQEDRGRKTQAEARTGSAVEAGVELARRFVTCRTVCSTVLLVVLLAVTCVCLVCLSFVLLFFVSPCLPVVLRYFCVFSVIFPARPPSLSETSL